MDHCYAISKSKHAHVSAVLDYDLILKLYVYLSLCMTVNKRRNAYNSIK